MSDSTPRLGLPDLPDTPELYADTMADALWRLDAFSDLCLKGQFVNTPPSSPADGDAYLTGGSPTGAWSGYAYKIATCRDGGWAMLTPFDGLRAWVEASNTFIVYCGGSWTDWNALLSAAEAGIASASSCDIGAAGALFLQVTGTTTITSFGAVANRLRFLRFAGALTLTHNATSLVLPGGASIVTAAGDTAVFASDASGNWRCRGYSRADGQSVAAALSVASLLTSGAAGIAAAAGGWNGNSQLSVYQGAVGQGIEAYNSAAGGTALNVRVDNTAVYYAGFYYNGAFTGGINTNGTVTAYNTTSDARLKTVRPQQRDYRGAIRALWVGDFTWDGSGAPGFGVLAQQAYEVMPNHQGVTKPDDEAAAWSASAEPFAHLALWGVKDLYAMIEALAARVAVLEAAHDAGR